MLTEFDPKAAVRQPWRHRPPVTRSDIAEATGDTAPGSAAVPRCGRPLFEHEAPVAKTTATKPLAAAVGAGVSNSPGGRWKHSSNIVEQRASYRDKSRRIASAVILRFTGG